MDRRQLLGSVVSAGMSSVLPTSVSFADAGTQVHPPMNGPRMNFAQADKIMTELGLDAMVLGTGVNLQHAIGARPVTTRMGRAPSTFAIVTRNEKQRLAMVAAAFTYYYTMADVLQNSDIPAYIYTAPRSDIEDGEPTAVPLTLFPDRGEEPIGAIERDRVAATEKEFAAQGAYATMESAATKALRDLGLSKARIAVDHPRGHALIEKAAPQATTVDADDALRRIRPVKSAIEIQLMRQAATGNVDAAMDALKTVRAGGSYRDLRAEFFAAAARRGQRGVFMVIDRTSDELYDNEFHEGQAFLIDCVSEYQGYHGDYGRTVFIGEPAKAMINATRAMADGWDSVREKLRPGLKFSDIQALGEAALRNSNKRYQIPFNPHSVGLYHTDHVGYAGLSRREDIVLEPGMILSIDCPLIEAGVGGSAHLEDLMLITADGSEPINDIGHQTITI